MRVRDRLTAVVVTLAFVLAGLGAAAAPAVTAPAVAPIVEALAAARPAPDVAPPVEALAAEPAAASASGTSPAALRAAYPRISWSELAAGPWHDHGGGLGYADGPDDLAPAALPRMAGPAVPEPVVPAPRPPVVPLPPRGPLAARAPPAA
ncbi:hypothetical protein [Micromonospora aurantiaca (nom. illeg.)]|uniref:hypothetical protein n=1 Tax=Micromonospora aurantiaca (nom. illeg.) TaxID=47850 RepID=UPI0008274C39|nr:hypothetical protein [Micromonospora aurantiaca]RNI03841.1 hypothetical protein EEZ25_10535 [Micromonospora aurantiaca]SCL41375.1 hypothetical protein GA0070615_4935 [Micromonospora aurantiaca]